MMDFDPSLQILVVDDDRDIGNFICALLRTEFGRADYVTDGATALVKLQEGDYRLVISDWRMWPMDGHTLLKTIRADGRLRDIPFIMVTAQASRASVTAATEAGVDAYVVKPFTKENLKDEVAAALQRKRTRLEGAR
jgi:two-component system chemotaxis response regulator CheY